MKIVDDIIIWATTNEEMWSRINTVLERCKAHNIAISRKKLEIGEEIEFAGLVISHKEIQPDPSKFRAIRDFPAPKNIKELRSYMGLANQLSSFIPDLQQCTSNMRKLLSPKNEYIGHLHMRKNSRNPRMYCYQLRWYNHSTPAGQRLSSPTRSVSMGLASP